MASNGVEDCELIKNSSLKGKELIASLSSPTGNVQSWLKPKMLYNTTKENDDRAFFDTYGFLVKRAFCTGDEVQNMVESMCSIVDNRWLGPAQEFRTDVEQSKAQGSCESFFESADKIHFFSEKKADLVGKHKDPHSEYSDKVNSLNKVGHGIHLEETSEFYKYTNSDKIRQLLNSLGWEKPCVPQSMYIFKQAVIGGEVTSHQDSTFLYTTPKQTCIGLWLALHDATLENGCLWVRPESHRENLRRKWTRKSPNEMAFEVINKSEAVYWEGKMPKKVDGSQIKGLFEAGFVPVEVKKGDLVCFPGTLDHLSLQNYSQNPRHTFQLHVVEGTEAGIQWDKGNWLQYPINKEFQKLM